MPIHGHFMFLEMEYFIMDYVPNSIHKTRGRTLDVVNTDGRGKLVHPHWQQRNTVGHHWHRRGRWPIWYRGRYRYWHWQWGGVTTCLYEMTHYLVIVQLTEHIRWQATKSLRSQWGDKLSGHWGDKWSGHSVPLYISISFACIS